MLWGCPNQFVGGLAIHTNESHSHCYTAHCYEADLIFRRSHMEATGSAAKPSGATPTGATCAGVASSPSTTAAVGKKRASQSGEKAARKAPRVVSAADDAAAELLVAIAPRLIALRNTDKLALSSDMCQRIRAVHTELYRMERAAERAREAHAKRTELAQLGSQVSRADGSIVDCGLLPELVTRVVYMLAVTDVAVVATVSREFAAAVKDVMPQRISALGLHLDPFEKPTTQLLGRLTDECARAPALVDAMLASDDPDDDTVLFNAGDRVQRMDERVVRLHAKRILDCAMLDEWKQYALLDLVETCHPPSQVIAPHAASLSSLMIDGEDDFIRRTCIRLIGQLDAADLQPHFGNIMLLFDPDGAHYSEHLCSSALLVLTEQPVHLVKDIPRLRERLEWAISEESPFEEYSIDHNSAKKLLRDLRAQ